MSAIEHEPNPWQAQIKTSLAEFHQMAKEYRQKASSIKWERTVNLAFPDFYDWAFAETLKLKNKVADRDKLPVKIEVAHTETTFAIKMKSKHSRQYVRLTFALRPQ